MRDKYAGVLRQLRERGALLEDGTLYPGALLTRRETEAFTRRSRSSIYRDKDEGTFPQPIRTGKRSVHWPGEALNQWKNGRPSADA